MNAPNDIKMYMVETNLLTVYKTDFLIVNIQLINIFLWWRGTEFMQKQNNCNIAFGFPFIKRTQRMFFRI